MPYPLDGFLYVADPGRFGFFEGKIVRIDPNAYDPLNPTLNQTIIISNRTGPTGVVFEADGNLLVTDSSAIVRFAPPPGGPAGVWMQVDGFLALFTPQVLNDIERDLDGSVVVAGFDPFRASDAQVTRVSSDGVTIATLTDVLRSASRVAIVPMPEPDPLLLRLTALGIGIFLAQRRAQERTRRIRSSGS